MQVGGYLSGRHVGVAEQVFYLRRHLPVYRLFGCFLANLPRNHGKVARRYAEFAGIESRIAVLAAMLQHQAIKPHADTFGRVIAFFQPLHAEAHTHLWK